MATLEEVILARQAENVVNAPLLKKTKLEEKNERLFGTSGKLPEKSATLTPRFNDDLFAIDANQSNRASLLDLAESTFYQSGGSLADMGKSISNSVFGSEFDDSVETGWSRPADVSAGRASAADEMAGISLAQRQAESDANQQVFNDYASGNYWEAAKGAVRQALPLVAGSAASGVELALGAIATPVVGAGSVVLAKKAKDTFSLIKKFTNSVDAAKEAAIAAKASEALENSLEAASKGSKAAASAKKAASLAKGVVKAASQTSLLTADIMQQTKNEYEAEYGEEMSGQRLVGATLMTIASTAAYPKIINKLYIPKVKKLKGKNLKEVYEKEVKTMMKYMDKSLVKSVADRVGAGIGKIAAAGGAEAVQEYVQTWANILSVHMKPEEAGGLLKAAWEQFGDKDKRNEAAVAGILGAAAGGTLKSVTAVPVVTVGTTVDTAVKTTQAAGKKIVEKTADSLSEMDKRVLGEEREGLEKATQEAKDEFKRKVGILEEVINSDSPTFSSITDEDVKSDLIAIAKTRDLNDPKVFEAASSRLIRAYAKDSVKATAVLKGKIGKKYAEAAYDSLPISDETKKAVIEKAKSIGEGFVNEVKNFKHSASYGVAEASVEYVADLTSKGKNKATETLVAKLQSEGSVESAREVASKIKEYAPLAAEELNIWANNQEARRKKVGLKTTRFYSYKDLSKNIQQTSAPNARVAAPLPLALDLRDAAKGDFSNYEAVTAVENSLENYLNTDFHKDGNQKGRLSNDVIENLQNKIKQRKSEIAQKTKSSNASKEEKTAVEELKEKTKEVLGTSLDFVIDKVVNENAYVAENTENQKKLSAALKDRIDEQISTKTDLPEGQTEEDAVNAKLAIAVELIKDPELAIITGKVFNSGDPEYIFSIYADALPIITEPSLKKDILEALKENLKDFDNTPKETVRVRKTPKPVKEVDSETDKVDTDTTNDSSEVIIEEEGAVFKKNPDLKKAKAQMERLLGSINICKV